jgi:hypothetical protein
MIHETLFQNTHHKKRGGRVAQDEGPEFKPPVPQKKKKKRSM